MNYGISFVKVIAISCLNIQVIKNYNKTKPLQFFVDRK